MAKQALSPKWRDLEAPELIAKDKAVDVAPMGLATLPKPKKNGYRPLFTSEMKNRSPYHKK